MTVVLDASATLVMLLDEPEVAVAAAVEDLVATRSTLVPEIWSWEIANALVMAERRGRITAEGRRRLALDVDRFPVVRAPVSGGVAALAELAASAGLTAYDACYLRLALVRGAALCSTDARLVAAARARGIVCVLDE